MALQNFLKLGQIVHKLWNKKTFYEIKQVLITYKTRAHAQLSVTLLPQAKPSDIYRGKMGTDRRTNIPYCRDASTRLTSTRLKMG